MTVSSDRIWDNVLKALAKWHKGGELYQGHGVLVINVKSMDGLNLSTQAAIAGALECFIQGYLQSLRTIALATIQTATVVTTGISLA